MKYPFVIPGFNSLFVCVSITVLSVGCDQTEPPARASSSERAGIDAQESGAPSGHEDGKQSARVCFVDMERIFASISVKQAEQAKVDRLAESSEAVVLKGRRTLAQLGARIKELQAALKELTADPEAEIDQDDLSSKRTELIKLAEQYRSRKLQLGGVANKLQRNVDLATVQASEKVWQECAKAVSGIAGKLGYDYVINLAASDKSGFPVVVARNSVEDDITEQVLALLSKRDGGSLKSLSSEDQSTTNAATEDGLPNHAEKDGGTEGGAAPTDMADVAVRDGETGSDTDLEEDAATFLTAQEDAYVQALDGGDPAAIRNARLALENAGYREEEIASLEEHVANEE